MLTHADLCEIRNSVEMDQRRQFICTFKGYAE